MIWKERGEPTSPAVSGKPEAAAPAARAPLPPPAPPPAAPTGPDSDWETAAPLLRPSLGSDTSISGRLSFTGPTRIDGRLRGEVRANELLVVGENAVVEGVVRAARLVVLGEVRGDVRDADRVEVAPGGRLVGSVEAHSLVVREGGCLDGDCRIAPPRTELRVVPTPAVGGT